MNVSIRKYLKSDTEGLKTCIRSLKEFEAQFDPDYLTTEESVEELFAGLISSLEDNTGTIFVAQNNIGQIVGFVSLEKSSKNLPEIVKRVEALYVSDLVVLPEFRSLGIGERLLQQADEYAKELGIKYLKLIVFAESNRVRDFYQRAGFKDYEITMIKQVG